MKIDPAAEAVDGERRERTEWHRLVLWRKLAEIAGQYLKKGSKIYVEGKLQTRSWDDQSGQKRYTTEVVVNDMQMLDSRGETSGGQDGGAPYASGPAVPVESQSDAPSTDPKEAPSYSPDDDLPF